MLNPFVIVGLGNVGAKYDFTRHNAGFFILDYLMPLFNVVSSSEKFNGDLQTVSFLLESDNLKGYLLKPKTFMNLSGECVRPFLDYYKISVSNLLVIHDDIDLKLGSMKFKCGGGDAGHNGLRSITSHLNTNNYYRLRVGVGRKEDAKGEAQVAVKGDVKDWVLGKFNSSEREKLKNVASKVKEYLPLFLAGDFQRFQEKINGIKEV